MSTEPIKPHGLFSVLSPDAVAECIDGVPQELYRRLWEVVPVSDKPRSEVPDDFDEYCLAKVWDKFTPEEQTKLNELAEKEESTRG